jgi:hypothetical protein
MRAINSGNGLYEANTKGENTIVIEGTGFILRVGVKQQVRQA